MALANVLKLQSVAITLSDPIDGWITAECPDIPGCVSQGRDRNEALANIADAIDACLEVIEEDTYGELRVKMPEIAPIRENTFRVPLRRAIPA